MEKEIPGIHHVTAIAGTPQENLDFYTQVLGLRLVKLTVNFDDPGAYHFYFADKTGSPGTILTFFPWPGARLGEQGAGQTTAAAYAVAEESLGYWQERLRQHGVETQKIGPRFGVEGLAFHDPDGLPLELLPAASGAELPVWDAGPVPPRHALRGIHSVTLWETDVDRTASLLTGTLGFELHAQEEERYRFQGALDVPGAFVDVVRKPQAPAGRMGKGVIHHIAWRTLNQVDQPVWQDRLAQRGLRVTDILDRQYFRSIYFREPGGVLFEIATDGPGFMLDETEGALGSQLKLPPWMEHERASIEEKLPGLHLPHQV